MDTSTLVVGQVVLMESGVYSCEGKVIKVTPSGVDVEIPPNPSLTLDTRQVLRFDNKGKGSDAQGTFECGSWYITLT